MAFRRRWLGLPVVLVLTACNVARSERANESGVAASQQVSARDARAVPDCGRAGRIARISATLDVGPADAAAPICLEIGQALRVHLPASPATGYGWGLEAGVPPPLRMETDPGVEPAAVLRLRAGPVHSWGFRAEHAGHALLRFAYRRPWETNAVPAQVAEFDVTVR